MDSAKPRLWLCDDEATPEAKMYQALRALAEGVAAGRIPLPQLTSEVNHWIIEATR